MEVKTLSIIIPVYNEEKTVKQVLQVVCDIHLPGNVGREIIVVNDASKDNSASELDAFVYQYPDAPVKLVTHRVNQGKGAGIRTGLKHATGEYVIIQDADLELIPQQISDLLTEVLEDRADVVYGSRFLKNANEKGSFLSRNANRFLSWLSNRAFGTQLTDMETCYKLMPTHHAQRIVLCENRFGFEPEITAKLAKVKGLRWKEVPITYMPRTGAQGKKIGWKDGVRAMWCIVKYGWLTPASKAFIQESRKADS